MNVVNTVLRFIFVLLLGAMALTILARFMIATELPWAGAAVWIAALALAIADAVFRTKERLS